MEIRYGKSLRACHIGREMNALQVGDDAPVKTGG
jgi:hypothetical protein